MPPILSLFITKKTSRNQKPWNQRKHWAQATFWTTHFCVYSISKTHIFVWFYDQENVSFREVGTCFVATKCVILRSEKKAHGLLQKENRIGGIPLAQGKKGAIDYDQVVRLRISNALHEAVKKTAQERGMTVSQFIRELLVAATQEKKHEEFHRSGII